MTMTSAVMPIVTALSVYFSVLFPGKLWFAPDQPLQVMVKPADGEVTLRLTDFAGKSVEAKGSTDVAGGKMVDLREMFPAIGTPGAYILYAVPKGGAVEKFVGTPLLINVLADRRVNAPPGAMVAHVQPLRYAVMSTEQGDMTLAFYYDVAPNTADNFVRLAEEGYYDGLKFHRIVPGFVIQGGDPRGDGTGGPGYQIVAEFNDRPHEEGVLSMARSGDPAETAGVMPRAEFANSAGSQFFICLDYAKTRTLDRKYTAFGKVVAGQDVYRKIAQAPVADAQTGRPASPPVIRRVQVMPVREGKNPYATLLGGQ